MSKFFEAPETARWLDLTDPDPIFYDRCTPLSAAVDGRLDIIIIIISFITWICSAAITSLPRIEALGVRKPPPRQPLVCTI